MGRPIKNTVLLVKAETAYGVDSTPSASTNAILVTNLVPPALQAQNVDRDLVNGALGASEQLVGTRYMELSFDVEIAGSGTATTAPRWGALLKACGFGETVQTASVDYTPLTVIDGVAGTSATIYYYLDGQLHIMLGARGSFSVEMGVGERPLFKFRFMGLYGGVSVVSNPTPTLTAWRTPLVVTDANTTLNTGTLTYTASTGVLSGGTERTCRGLRWDIGNTVVHQPLLGGESIQITEREVTGGFSLDINPTQAVSFMGDVLDNVNTGVGLTHGTTTGDIVVLHAPKVQRINPTIEDLNGNAMHAYQLRAIPVTGNDELRIVSR